MHGPGPHLQQVIGTHVHQSKTSDEKIKISLAQFAQCGQNRSTTRPAAVLPSRNIKVLTNIWKQWSNRWTLSRQASFPPPTHTYICKGFTGLCIMDAITAMYVARVHYITISAGTMYLTVKETLWPFGNKSIDFSTTVCLTIMNHLRGHWRRGCGIVHILFKLLNYFSSKDLWLLLLLLREMSSAVSQKQTDAGQEPVWVWSSRHLTLKANKLRC